MSGDAIRCYQTAFDTMQKIKTVCVSENHLFARMAMAESNEPSKYWEKMMGVLRKIMGVLAATDWTFVE